jgi:hypothetical protein
MEQTLNTDYVDLLVPVFVWFVIYLPRLWATQCIASNGTVISEEWTGKDVERIGHITILNNTSVSTFTARSKENLHGSLEMVIEKLLF